MDIGIIGVGHIGGNCARQAVHAGHTVALSFARDLSRLDAFAEELGPTARIATLSELVEAVDAVIVSVPWVVLDTLLTELGDIGFGDRIVIDTTNQFTPVGVADLGGVTAARHNALRFRRARYAKTFNTLTARFQADVVDRSAEQRVVQWISGEDNDANDIVVALVNSMGYEGVVLGGLDDAGPMEAPRRAGSVYGEEYRLEAAEQVVAALRRGDPIPPTPAY